MSIGDFKETNETSEAGENTDNTEKPRNQILETPESYDDGFDSKLDNRERENESKKEGNVEGNESAVVKISFLDKMRNLFAKKESTEESGDSVEKNAEAGNSNSRRPGFHEYLREGAPSMEEQAEQAKELSGLKEYQNDREKSEQAKRDYPDMKDWELSSEQLKEAQQGQQEAAGDGASEKEEQRNEKNDGGRTPGDEAWERRFGRIEGEG